MTGGGLSTFYFKEAASGFVADVSAFFDAVKGVIAGATTIRIPGSGDLIDEGSGVLSGTWNDGSTTTIVSTGGGQWAQGVGARIRWNTAGITSGRRVRGSTYLVPITVGQYDGSNGLVPAAVTAMDAAADALVTAQLDDFVIWTRPRPGVVGKSSAVLSADAPDTVSWLRTRRT